MSRFLIVTWDGAGNLVPTLGIARGLSAAGHDVRVLGHPSIDERCGHDGWRFVPFPTAARYDSVRPGDLAGEMPFLMANVFFGDATAADTVAEFQREESNAVMCDALMASAICAAEALPVPAAVLYHTAFGLFRAGPLLEMITPAVPMLEPIRQNLGLDPISTLPDLHDRADLGLVAGPSEFEPPGTVAPPNVRFVGPILDGLPLGAPSERFAPHASDEPLVLVSFSTSDMAQALTLQRVIDALSGLDAHVLVTTGPAVDPRELVAAPNTQVVSYVPHADVLAHAAVVVTHAGLGTVMTALSYGVPIVGLPMGRDQFYNASRAAELGVGSALPPDASAELIATTVANALGDGEMRNAARAMATTIESYGGSTAAVAELELLTK